MHNYRADTIWDIRNTESRRRERVNSLTGMGLQQRGQIFLGIEEDGTGLAKVIGER